MRASSKLNKKTIHKTITVLTLAFIPILAGRTSGQVPTHPPALPDSKYFSETAGTSVDELVKLALSSNLEVIAMRQEVEAGEALIRQARLRPNPSLEVGGTRQIGGMGSNSLMVQGALPLELGGRRSARIRVAEVELEIRRRALEEKERQVAAEVRAKYAESLASIFKLAFLEELLVESQTYVDLVRAKVGEGRLPPLEESMETVELNRIRAEKEIAEGMVEVRLLELRNLANMTPESPLQLKGDLDTLKADLPPQIVAEQKALQSRPDLLGATAVERLAAARTEQARSEGRIDADVMLGFQRMRNGFPLLGIEESTGALLPIRERMNIFTFGVRLNLPLRDRNQGLVAASILEEKAARSRRDFGEITIRREVAAAYARYNRSVRATEIYRVGVRERAAANLDVVRQTYELGSKTLLDFISEHHRFIQIENGFIDAQLEAYLAMVDVLKASNDTKLK